MIEYLAGTKKGETTNGDLLNSPFQLGNVDEKYTSDRVVETKEAGSSTKFTPLSWTPVEHGVFEYNNTLYDVKITSGNDGTVSYAYVKDADGKIYTDAAYTTEYSSNYADKVAYVYNNIVVPQNDLPTIRAEMKSIPLLAKARRIAVYYSQIAAFQAKTDHGIDLGDQLAEKAVGQLAYEIDTEVVQMLIDNAAAPADNSLVWSKTLPVGVSKVEHYIGFLEILEVAKQKVYDATKRFVPNYMIIASDILPVLSMIPSFKAAPATSINGPYYAGTIGSLKVFVSPAIDPGNYVVGVNGNDMMTSAAVYAPYMAIVPTQLLQYADGGTTQGLQKVA